MAVLTKKGIVEKEIALSTAKKAIREEINIQIDAKKKILEGIKQDRT